MPLLVLVPSELEKEALEGLPLEIEVVGVGPVDSALNAHAVFLNKKPTLAFLTGFAGAYPNSELRVGDVVVGTCERHADLGRAYPTHLVPLPEALGVKDYCPLAHVFTEKLIYLLELNGFYPQAGPLATVCSATYDVRRAKAIEERFQVLAENMEGFGVARAARKAKVPLLEVRIISNFLAKPEEPWDLEKAKKRLHEVWECIVQNWK